MSGAASHAAHVATRRAIWSTHEPARPAEAKARASTDLEGFDVETHLNLGIAYLEMGLRDDAVVELAVVVLADADTAMTRAALAKLLAPPLLTAEGVAALRRRLAAN